MKVSVISFGGVGFTTVSPITKETDQYSKDYADSRNIINNSFIQYFSPSESAVLEYLDVRRRCASFSEWVIGCCKTPLTPPSISEGFWRQEYSVEHWDVEFLLKQHEKINSFSMFDGETGEVVLLSRLFRGIDEHLSRIKMEFGSY
jgi:hypothetical protein